MELAELTSYLDRELGISEIPDYPGAHNGLQLEAAGPVGKVAAAVDASLPVVEQAVREGADLLLVHHGMFWQGVQAVTGAYFKKLKTAMDAGMAIYSAHIPLDVHEIWGNNAQLADALELRDRVPFFEWKGIQLGLAAKSDEPLAAFAKRLEAAVGGSVHVCPGGPERIGRVGVITGGAGSEVAAVAAEGIDTFVTGEGPHWSFPLAEELGVNLLYAGHYATETFGVRALAEHLAGKFGLQWCFIDHPTGL